MSSKAQVGIEFLLDEASFKTTLQQLTQFTITSLGGVQAEISAHGNKTVATVAQSVSKATQEVSQALHSQVAASASANEAIAKAEAKMNDVRTKYNKDSGKQIIDDMKKLQDEKATILHASTLTVEKEAKAELAARKKEIDDELRLMKQVALEKKDVQEGGAGAKAGILGTGRQIIGGAASGIGGAAGSLLAGGAVAGLAMEGFNKLHEYAAIADDASDNMSIAFQKAGLSGKALEDAIDDAGKSATKMADDFAMPKHEVMALQATIAGYGNITGENLTKLTEISIGSANAMGMNAESVAKLIAKGADPEQEAQLKKLGIEFGKTTDASERMRIIQEKLGPAIQATKDSTQDSMGAFDRMKNKLMDTATAFADKAFSALQPIFEALMTVIDALMPVVDGLIPIVVTLAGVFGDTAKELALALVPLLKELTPIIVFLANVISTVLKFALGLAVDGVKLLIQAITQVVKWIKDAAEAIYNFTKGIVEFFSSSGGDKKVKQKVEVEQQVTVQPESQQQIEEKHDKAQEFAEKAAAKNAAKSEKIQESAEKKAERLRKEAFDKEKKEREEFYKEKQIELDLQLAKGEVSEEYVKRHTLENTIALNDELAEIARTHGEQDIQFRLNSAKAQADHRKFDADRELEATAKKYDDQAEALKLSLDKEEITQEQYAIKEKELAVKRAAERIAILKKYAVDSNTAGKDLEKAQKDKANEEEKQERDHQKELKKIADEAREKEISVIEDSHTREIALEEWKYNQELEQLRKSTDNKLVLKAKEAQLLERHNEKVKEIDAKAQKEQEERVKGYYARVVDFFSEGADQKRKKAKEFAAQELLGLEANFFEQEGIVKKFLLNQLVSYISSKWAEVAVVQSTEAAKTGATQGGILQRIPMLAQEIGTNVASAASAAYGAVASAIKWITTIIPFPFSLALIPAAIAGIYGLYTGARKLFKFGEGGIVQRAQRFSFGPNNEFEGERGEAGDEAIIPLHKLPGIMQSLNLLPSAAASSLPIVQELRDLHDTMKKQPAPIVLDQYANKISQDQALSVVNSRRL